MLRHFTFDSDHFSPPTTNNWAPSDTIPSPGIVPYSLIYAKQRELQTLVQGLPKYHPNYTKIQTILKSAIEKCPALENWASKMPLEEAKTISALTSLVKDIEERALTVLIPVEKESPIDKELEKCKRMVFLVRRKKAIKLLIRYLDTANICRMVFL